MFAPESPRWLYSKHKYDEMVSLLQKIAKWNGVHPEDDAIQLRLPLVDKDKSDGEDGKRYSHAIWASRHLKSSTFGLLVQ